jgi:PAS domain S-box-containing protein
MTGTSLHPAPAADVAAGSKPQRAARPRRRVASPGVSPSGRVLHVLLVAGLAAVTGYSFFREPLQIAIATSALFILVIVRMSLMLLHLQRAGATERDLATIVETSSDAIIGETLEGIVTSWNGAAEAMYGYAATEIVGRPMSLLLPPAAEDDLGPNLERIRQGKRVDRYTTTRMMKDGGLIDVELSVSPTRDAEGAVTGGAVIARDITEKVRSQEKLAMLQDARAKLLERTISAGEQERKMLAAELHDGPVQHLTALDVKLETLRERIGPVTPGSTVLVERLQRGLQKSILELRRLMVGLHPPALRERGLRPALADYLAGIQRSSDIDCHLEVALPSRLHADIEITLYRIFQEALMNVIKHSGANNVWVTLSTDEGHADLVVQDDGGGFGVDSPEGATSMGEHYGLIGMRERAEMVGGIWELSSSDRGTRVHVRLPMEVTS